MVTSWGWNGLVFPRRSSCFSLRAQPEGKNRKIWEEKQAFQPRLEPLIYILIQSQMRSCLPLLHLYILWYWHFFVLVILCFCTFKYYVVLKGACHSLTHYKKHASKVGDYKIHQMIVSPKVIGCRREHYASIQNEYIGCIMYQLQRFPTKRTSATIQNVKIIVSHGKKQEHLPGKP